MRGPGPRLGPWSGTLEWTTRLVIAPVRKPRAHGARFCPLSVARPQGQAPGLVPWDGSPMAVSGVQAKVCGTVRALENAARGREKAWTAGAGASSWA